MTHIESAAESSDETFPAPAGGDFPQPSDFSVTGPQQALDQESGPLIEEASLNSGSKAPAESAAMATPAFAEELEDQRQVEISELPLTSIRVRQRIRQINEAAIPQMLESMEQRGIIQPLTVRPISNSNDYELVAGYHRFESARRLSWSTIACRILSLSEAQAELVEIDENLIRSELSEAEWTLCLSRRQRIYEDLHGPAKAAGAHAANAAMGRRANAKMALAFTADAARLTGKSRRTIQRATQRVAELGEDVVKAVVGTTLDRGTELDTLCELPQEERQALVEQAKSGALVSALRRKTSVARTSDASGTSEACLALNPSASTEDIDAENITAAQLAALISAWGNASEPARAAFRQWLSDAAVAAA
jgi:ParB-like chromosome segregation protein Spo0J